MVNNKLIMLALFGVLFSISYSIVGHAQARCWSQIDTFYKQNKTNLYEKAVDLIVPGEFDSRGDKQLIRTIDLYSFINKETGDTFYRTLSLHTSAKFFSACFIKDTVANGFFMYVFEEPDYDAKPLAHTDVIALNSPSLYGALRNGLHIIYIHGQCPEIIRAQDETLTQKFTIGDDPLRIFGTGVGCFVFYVDSGFVRFLDFVPNE